METVKVLIKIPEKAYKQVIKQGDIKNGMNSVYIAQAIINGTVLPKGHGRLIDADKIIYHRCPDNVLDCPQSYDFTCQHCDFGIATKFRTDAIPAIIEADKEVE